jgi:hypothetical protein
MEHKGGVLEVKDEMNNICDHWRSQDSYFGVLHDLREFGRG